MARYGGGCERDADSEFTMESREIFNRHGIDMSEYHFRNLRYLKYFARYAEIKGWTPDLPSDEEYEMGEEEGNEYEFSKVIRGKDCKAYFSVYITEETCFSSVIVMIKFDRDTNVTQIHYSPSVRTEVCGYGKIEMTPEQCEESLEILENVMDEVSDLLKSYDWDMEEWVSFRDKASS